MKYEDQPFPAAIVVPGGKTVYGKALPRKEEEVDYMVYVQKYAYK